MMIQKVSNSCSNISTHLKHLTYLLVAWLYKQSFSVTSSTYQNSNKLASTSIEMGAQRFLLAGLKTVRNCIQRSCSNLSAMCIYMVEREAAQELREMFVARLCNMDIDMFEDRLFQALLDENRQLRIDLMKQLRLIRDSMLGA